MTPPPSNQPPQPPYVPGPQDTPPGTPPGTGWTLNVAPVPRKKMSAGAIIGIVLASLVALCLLCGVIGLIVNRGNDDPDQATPPRDRRSSVAPAATSAATATSRPADCVAADAAVIARIAAGAKQGTGMDMTGRGATVRSPDHTQVYLVAAEFTVSGASQKLIGVWATNELDGTGFMLAVDGFAKQFTTWGDASKTDAAIRGGEPAVARAKACLTG